MIASVRTVDLVPLTEVLALGPTTWDALLRDSPTASPFATWAWHRAWAEASPPDDVGSSRALALRSPGGELQALLPFRVWRTRFRRVPVTALGWAVGDLGSPDHLDLPALPDADLGPLVPALDRLPWDVMVFDNVAECSPNLDRLLAACERRGWWVRRAPVWRCPYLTLPRSWDAYLAPLSRARRETVRRKERSLFRAHSVVVTDYGPGRLREGWQRLKELHALRWGDAEALATPVKERLHLAFAEMLAGRGALWLTTLDVDGAAAAAWYGFALGDTVSFYQSGWDPRWERESVGTVLMGLMIRRAIERGYRVFDFLRGEEPYKLSWTHTARSCYQVAVIRRSWRGAMLRGVDTLAQWRDSGRASHV